MEPPLVGREEEYQSVVNYLQRRLHDESFDKLLFLCGPCGAGKTSTLMRVMPKQFTALSLGTREGESSSSVSVGPVEGSPLETEFTNLAHGSSSSSIASAASEPKRTFRACYVNCADRTAKDLVAQCCELLTTHHYHHQRDASLRDLRLSLLNAVLKKSKQQVETEITRALSQCREASALLRSGVPIFDTLPVFILDEADFAKPSASHAIRWMARLSQCYPRLFAVILVSNSRTLSFVPESESVIVNFKAYDAAALKKIGEEAMQKHLIERQEAHAQVSFSGREAARSSRSGVSSAESSTLPAAALSVAPAAVAFAAKTALFQHGGDARKVQEICRRAVDETHRSEATAPSSKQQTFSKKSAADGMSPRTDAALLQPPPAACGAAPIANTAPGARNLPRDALATVPSNTKPGAVVAAAVSCAPSTTTQQRKKRGRCDDESALPLITTITLSHVMSAAKDVTRPDAMRLVQSLPELTTYVLCCVVAVARRHAIEEYFCRVHIGGGGGTRKDDDVSRAVQHTNHKGVKDCGQIRAQEVHRTYASLMNKLLFPTSSFEAVLRSLEDLSSRRVITRPDHFVVTGEWSLIEMEEALLQRGKDVARRDAELTNPAADSERAGLAMSNKFENAIRTLSCIV